MDDHEFLEAFLDGRLGRPAHLDTVRAVALIIQRDGAHRGLPVVREALHRITHAAGVPERYHETLTVAWYRLIADAVAADAATAFDELIARHPRLGRSDLLDAHYSRALLFSSRARAAFVEPDLSPLPGDPAR